MKMFFDESGFLICLYFTNSHGCSTGLHRNIGGKTMSVRSTPLFRDGGKEAKRRQDAPRWGDPHSCVCQTPNAFTRVSPCGSILGPIWVHFGSILGPFWVNLGSMLGPESISGPFKQESVFRQELVFGQECSPNKNSNLDCEKRASEASKSERAKRAPLCCGFSRRI